MSEVATDTTGFSAGTAVAALGLVFSVVHLAHGLGEYPGELAAVLYGVLLPLLVSIAILLGGVWIVRRDWSGLQPWRLVAWMVGGLVVGVGLSGLMLQYQLAEGVTPSDPLFVQAMFGTYGGALGLLIGWYDDQRLSRELELERKTERLEEFSSFVSHDLRNPLTVAQGQLELARDGSGSEHLEAVARAHRRMEALIEDLLTLTREGEPATERASVHLPEICRDCWQNVSTDNADLAIETTTTVRADPARLRRLLENLIRNAIEYGPPDVTVTVGDVPRGFYLEDDGPGIDEDERARVFESGYSTSPEGTGLGLTIVKEIAEAHGWQVSVTEGTEGGARFEFEGVETG